MTNEQVNIEQVNIERRLTSSEHRLQTHAEKIELLLRQTQENTEMLHNIRRALDRVLWTLIGCSMVYSASQIGLAEMIKRLM